MYPKNAASPERIAIGAVVQISDGAVQTSGVSISVRGQSGSPGAGGGTTAYDNGIVEYTPLQAETNFTSFVVVAYKTGCIPVSQTIITVAGSTPGLASLATDQAVNVTKVNGTTQTAGDLAAMITAVDDYVDTEVSAIKTKTDFLPSATAGSAGGLFIAGTNAATTITTALTTTFTGNLTGTVAKSPATLAAADVSGNLPVDVQTIKTQAVTCAAGVTVPTSIASPTNITAGTITTVTNLTNAPTAGDLTATMKTSITAAVPTVAGIADGVWDEAIAGHVGAGSTGNALSTASSGGVDPAVLADAIWDEALSGHATAGTAGKKLTDLANADLSAVATSAELAKVPKSDGSLTFNVTCSSDIKSALATQAELNKVPKSDGASTWNATALASLQAEATDALNAYDPPTKAELDSAVSPLATAASLATVAGYIDTEVAAILAAVDTEVAAIKAKTDNLPTDPADQSLIIAATDAIATAIAALPQNKTGYTLAAGGIPVGAFSAGAITDAATAADMETAIANAVLAGVVETQGSYTLKQALSICLAVLAGVTADGGATIKTPNGAATRVSATVNASNERTAMTVTP